METVNRFAYVPSKTFFGGKDNCSKFDVKICLSSFKTQKTTSLKL